MRVQFRCCLCGQQNITDLTPEDELNPRSLGFARRLLGLFRSKPKAGARPRYTVRCEFCNQNNKISAPPSRSQRPA